MDSPVRMCAACDSSREGQAFDPANQVSLLGQLAASIIHELRQPLSAIMSNAEAAQLLLDRESVDLAELRQVCREIVAEDRRAVEIIARLASLYQGGECLRDPIDLNLLVNDTISLVSHELARRHVTVGTQLAPSVPGVLGDRVQLQRLLLNLISNAADAMPNQPDGRCEITISTSAQSGIVKLSVVDRGDGVPSEAREKIFEPFWSTRPGGMGMGLAICRSIASAHRGTLSVTTAATGGAEFCVSLPEQQHPQSGLGSPRSS